MLQAVSEALAPGELGAWVAHRSDGDGTYALQHC